MPVSLDCLVACSLIEPDGIRLEDARLQTNRREAFAGSDPFQLSQDSPGDSAASEVRTHVHPLNLPFIGSPGSKSPATHHPALKHRDDEGPTRHSNVVRSERAYAVIAIDRTQLRGKLSDQARRFFARGIGSKNFHMTGHRVQLYVVSFPGCWFHL